MITSFTGPYAFLSNFSPHPVLLPGLSDIPFATAEHAFQAAKTSDPAGRAYIVCAPTPGEAKARGRRVPLSPGWDQVRRRVMMDVILAKFGGELLAARLAATAPHVLVEGNHWGDAYWGAVRASQAVMLPPGAGEPPVWRAGASLYLAGHNWLGRILMMTRELIS